MSVRERLIAELLLLGRDGHELVGIIESQFDSIAENPERVRQAREILAGSSLSGPNLAKLAPLLSRFVLEYSESKRLIAQIALEDEEEATAVNVLAEPARKKKPKKTKLSAKDLQEMFDLRGSTTVQRYSDDEGAPKPKIITMNKPAIAVMPRVIAEPRPRPPPPPSKPSAWVEPAVIVSKAPVDYGGFW